MPLASVTKKKEEICAMRTADAKRKKNFVQSAAAPKKKRNFLLKTGTEPKENRGFRAVCCNEKAVKAKWFCAVCGL